jgi:Fe-S-cluster containining protein
MTVAASRRAVLWAACREKTCCRATRVVLTCRDVARLAGALDLLPSTFAVALPVDEGEEGLVFEPGGRPHQLALRKNGAIGPAGAPCVFLVETNDEHALCGVEAVQPAVCRSHPAIVVDGAVRIAGGFCTCHRWTLLDLDEAERDLARLAEAELQEHRGVVRQWNVHVAAGGVRRSPDDLLRWYLEQPKRAVPAEASA